VVAGRLITHGCVELHCRNVLPVGKHPGFQAAELASHIQQRAQQRLADSTPTVGRRDADFVDPKFRARFIGMNVTHRRCKSDDKVVLKRDDKVMTAVPEELCSGVSIDRIIKHIRCDIGENMLIPGTKDLDLNRHFEWLAPFTNHVPLR
jgi:hypothetical protein